MAPDKLEWRIIDHCAAVTRIYAIYEQFVHEMVREHLSLLQSRMSFGELPVAIQASYRSGMAKIIEKIDGPRFGDLDLAKLVGGYNSALMGEDYVLEPRAMLMQEQNLRFQELQRFLNACGIEDVGTWIEQHRSIKSFFAVGGRLSASAANEMAELIKYRNDAAHGSIDISDILNINGLVEFCEFVMAVCEALSERVQLAGLKILEAQSHVRVGGRIKESLRGGLVAIGEMAGQYKVGETIYLCGGDYCLERRVVSLQLDDVSHEAVDLAPPAELGILLDAPGKKGAFVMIVEPLTAPVEMAVSSGINDLSEGGAPDHFSGTALSLS
jgi:hypothetical protein